MLRLLLNYCLPLLISPALAGLGADAGAQPGNRVGLPGETWRNAYAQDLGERHIELGRAAMISGELVEAERSLLEAIQVIKINHGLRSRRQIPALRLLIETQIHLGDWPAVDRQVDYFQWLNARNYSLDFDAYLEGMSNLDELLLMASARLDNPRAVRYLIVARDLNWQALTAIEARFGKSHRARRSWLYRIVLNHYYQSTLIRRRGLTSYAFKSDGDTLVSGWSLSRNETLDISYRVGQDLLQQIHTLYREDPRATPGQRAVLMAYRGDWELLFGYHQRGYGFYRQAHDSLLAAGLSPAAANSLFATPVTLPARALPAETATVLGDNLDGNRTLGDNREAFGVLREATGTDRLQFHAWSPLYPATPRPASLRAFETIESPTMRASARFDLVPPRGQNQEATAAALRLENFTLLDTDPESPQIREQAARQIALLSFRPKLVDGHPVAARALELDYRFPPQLAEASLSDF